MQLSKLKTLLPELEQIRFRLPDGRFVPDHFHITEVGWITRHFIDCGGTLRNEHFVHFQLWHDHDLAHRLEPAKLLRIIRLSEEKLGLPDAAIEVEHQGTTIGRYDLDFRDGHFELVNKQTACLATDACGIPAQKPKIRLADITADTCCAPGQDACCPTPNAAADV